VRNRVWLLKIFVTDMIDILVKRKLEVEYRNSAVVCYLGA